MNIAVYLGSAEGNDPAFRTVTAELGHWMGTHGHTLVYGGSRTGLMGLVCDSCLDAGGKVIGVLPKIDLIRELLHPSLTQTIWTRDMAQRRSRMIALSQAFIALPGGIGTLDEISEVICLIKIREISGPCIMLGPNSYWEPFRKMCDHMTSCGLLDRPIDEDIHFCETVSEAAVLLEAHTQSI